MSPSFSNSFSNKVLIPTSIYLQKSASIQPRTSPSKFAGKLEIWRGESPAQISNTRNLKCEAHVTCAKVEGPRSPEEGEPLVRVVGVERRVVQERLHRLRELELLVDLLLLLLTKLVRRQRVDLQFFILQ